MTELSERKKKILGTVVEEYIRTGEPVGSKGLITAAGLTVSSATVRNEMSELISLGFLEQPHTSAGRIPSQAGYRYYIDFLMKKLDVDELTKKVVNAGLSSAAGDPERLVIKAGEVLADITKCACISTAPNGSAMIIKRIELVPVGTHTAMLLLLTSNGILKSRLCRLDCDIDAQMCEEFGNVVKRNIIGRQACELDTATMQTLAASLDFDYFSFLPLLAAVNELAASTADSKVILGGSSNLFIHKDYGENAAASLLEFLNKKEPVMQVIDISDNDFSIKIGRENMFRQLEQSSVIVSRYSVNGDKSGVVGLIGPTRINYEIIIPGIKYLSDMLGKLITQALED
ncbi:MAG: heat-inducible transcriptional repressor HrcA [Clostridiales bacterium]|nr:heat-inducible transcriptional repressor HrcA [Clostridiales bacterium]